MMYVRFPLSLRNVEDLLFERGFDIRHETVRLWWNRFGPMFAGEIRRQRVSRMKGLRHWRWHLDEMYVKLNGEMAYAQRVYEPKDGLTPLPPIRTIGLVRSDQAAAIDRALGTTVQGYDFSIDVPAAGHVFRKHGDAAAERSRGQRAITPADFGMLPQILSRPDQIRPSGTTKMDEQLLAFEKRIGSETYIAEMAVRGLKRRTLALKTFCIRVSGKK